MDSVDITTFGIIEEYHLNNIRFAVLIAGREIKLESLLKKVIKESEKKD